MHHSHGLRPRGQARLAGALYILIIVCGAYAELVGRQGVVVVGDAAATGRAIVAHAGAFRLGFAAEMLTNMLAVPATLIIYRLLAPCGPFLALVAVAFDLTQNTINAVNALTQFAPLTLLGGSPELAAIPADQLAAWARLALRWHDVGFSIGLTFFGVALPIYAWLIARSEFLPRWLGALYALAGGCYLLQAYIFFFAPGLSLASFATAGCLLGEGGFALWLLVVGLDEPRWLAVAAPSAEGRR